MKNPAKLLPKNAHCLGQEEKIPDLVLYHQTTILTTLKKFFYPGQCLAFLAWKDIDKWCLKAKG
jgi:hypothetical protein